MGNVINQSTKIQYGDAVVKFDPWSNTLATKNQFFAMWNEIYQQGDLDLCWHSLHQRKKWDPWSGKYIDKESFLVKWQSVHKDNDLMQCWECLRFQPEPYPNYLKWPVRCQVMSLLNAVPHAKTYAVVSLMYAGGIEVLCQGLALGHSLVGKTKYPCVLLHSPDVPAEYLSVLGQFWTLQQVQYIVGTEKLTAKMQHFKNVFTKFHIFNKKVLPFDRILFLDLDTLVTSSSCVDDVLECGYVLAAVGCPTQYFIDGGQRKKQVTDTALEGQCMDHGLTFNGGVMLVSPHIGIFDILHKDCQQASNWHYSTSYPESHYLKWIADWRFLAQSLNLCPRMGKGQANTRDWQHLSWREVEIFHYSTQSKPYYWFKQGTIDTCCNIASGMSDELVVQVKERAGFAYNMWLIHLFLAILNIGISKKIVSHKMLVLWLFSKHWYAYIQICKDSA